VAKYRAKPLVMEAVQLTWENWSEISAFADVGDLSDGKAMGCYIGPDGQALTAGQTSDVLGLVIPTQRGLRVGRQHDWIIKWPNGELDLCAPETFPLTYEKVEE